MAAADAGTSQQGMHKRFGRLLREVREGLGLTAVEAAARVSIDVSTLLHAENGRALSWQSARELVTEYGIPHDQIAGMTWWDQRQRRRRPIAQDNYDAHGGQDMTDRLIFEIPGRPVPYTRQTHRSKHVDRQAQRYNGYKQRVASRAFVAAREQGWEVPEKGGDEPVCVDVDLYLEKGPWPDGDNLYKAICDALQPGVIPKDRVVEVPQGSFKTIFGEGERVVVAVERLDGDE